MSEVKFNQYASYNRNTTYDSLKAFVLMILATNKEDFIKYYSLAAHEASGAGIWYHIQKLEEEENRRNLNKTKKRRIA